MLWVVVKLIEQSLKWKVSPPPSQNKSRIQILFRGAEEAGVWRRANWSLEFCGEHLPHNAPVTVTGARHRYEYMQQQRNRIFKFLKWLLAIVTRYRYCSAISITSIRKWLSFVWFKAKVNVNLIDLLRKAVGENNKQRKSRFLKSTKIEYFALIFTFQIRASLMWDWCRGGERLP